MRGFSRVRRKLVALVLAFTLSVSTLLVTSPPIKAEASDNPFAEFFIEQGLDRALSIVCYYASYGLHAIDDAVDDEAYSQVVSWFDAFIWDTEVTWALQEIEAMLDEILKELDLVAERQTEYGQAVLKKMDNDEIKSAQEYLDQKIDEDINASLVYNGINTSQVIEAYTKYLRAANEYGSDTASYEAQKEDFDRTLDNLLGKSAKTDEMRYVSGTIGAHLHNVLYNLIDNMCKSSDSSQYITDETVMDAAAQLAYLYYPWSQDQYDFVHFELDSQVQEIVLVAMIYEEYLARQYDYLKANGYLDDESSVGAKCYANNKANLKSDNIFFAERFYDYTEKPLKVSPTVQLKLYQYYKPTDMVEGQWFDYEGNSYALGTLYNENYRSKINYHDEEDGYLSDDFNDGPLDGIDDDNFTNSVSSGQLPYTGINMYPVMRNGGVDLYGLDNNYVDSNSDLGTNIKHTLGSLVTANGASWGWGEQGFPTLNFYNRYHGKFAPIISERVFSDRFGERYYNGHTYTLSGEIDREYQERDHTYYRMARSISEIKPLLSSDAYSVFYGGNLKNYLSLTDKSAADYVLFGDYSVSNNTAAGGTGKVSLNLLPVNANYDEATVDTYGKKVNSHEIIHDGKDSDGGLYKDKTYTALYVPDNPGNNMTTFIHARAGYYTYKTNGVIDQGHIYDQSKRHMDEFADIKYESQDGKIINPDYGLFEAYNADGTSSKIELKAGEMFTIKVRVNNENDRKRYIPDSVYMVSTPMLYGTEVSTKTNTDKLVEIAKQGSLNGLEPDEDGYYSIEVCAPYVADAAFSIAFVEREDSVVNETNALTNESGAYLKHTEDELTQLLLTDKEQALAKNGADIRFKLTGTGLQPVASDVREKFEKLADKTGYKVSDRYIDLSVTKRVKFRDPEKIEVLPGGQVTVAMQLPDKLKGNGNREYKLLREHDGKVDIINADYDAATNELSFATDRFSKYAIIYRDKRSSPKTGQI